jgi:hypothetical protein
LLFFVNPVKIKEKQAQRACGNTNTTAIPMVKLFWMLSTPWILQNELDRVGEMFDINLASDGSEKALRVKYFYWLTNYATFDHASL